MPISDGASPLLEETLAEIARELDIGSQLIMGSGEHRSGGHQRNSVLANALEALFGGSAPRSATERAALDSAGARTGADVGIRSGVGSPDTAVVDKGSTTRDIVAAPQGDGRDAQTQAGTPAPAASPTPQD